MDNIPEYNICSKKERALKIRYLAMVAFSTFTILGFACYVTILIRCNFYILDKRNTLY
jgi:hypothetical protein